MTDAATQRLFFALWPSPELRRQLAAAGEGWLTTPCRRVPPANLHLTLAFLGAVPAPVCQCLVGQCATVRVQPFELQLDRLGHWRRSRIAWLGPSRTPAALTELVSLLGQAQRACGLTPETTPYRPHVTLARKCGDRLPAASVEAIEWSAREFCLVESVLTAQGAHYRVIQRWNLCPPGG